MRADVRLDDYFSGLLYYEIIGVYSACKLDGEIPWDCPGYLIDLASCILAFVGLKLMQSGVKLKYPSEVTINLSWLAL